MESLQMSVCVLGSCYVTQASLELMVIPLPRLLECWDCKGVPPSQCQGFLFCT